MILLRTSIGLVLFLFMLISPAHRAYTQFEHPPLSRTVIISQPALGVLRTWKTSGDKEKWNCYLFLSEKESFTGAGDGRILVWEPEQILIYRFWFLGQMRTERIGERTLIKRDLAIPCLNSLDRVDKKELSISRKGKNSNLWVIAKPQNDSAAKWLLTDTETLKKLLESGLKAPTVENLLKVREEFPAGIYLLGKFTSNFSVVDLSKCLRTIGECSSEQLGEGEAETLTRLIEDFEIVQSMMARSSKAALGKIEEELNKILLQRPDLCVRVDQRDIKLQEFVEEFSGKIEGKQEWTGDKESTYDAFVRLDLWLRSLPQEVPGFQPDHEGDGFNPNPKEGIGIKPGLKQWAEVIEQIDYLACHRVRKKVLVVGHPDPLPYSRFGEARTRLPKELTRELNSWLAYYRGLVGMYELLCSDFLGKPEDQLEQSCKRYERELKSALDKWKEHTDKGKIDEIGNLFPRELERRWKIKFRKSGKEIEIHNATREMAELLLPTLGRSVELCLPDLWGFLTKDEKNFHSEGCKQEGKRASQSKSLPSNSEGLNR